MNGRLWTGWLIFMLVGASAAQAAWGYSGSKTWTDAELAPHPLSGMMASEQWSGTVVFAKDHVLNFNLIISNLTAQSDKAVLRVEYHTPDGAKLEDATRCTVKPKQAEGLQLTCGKQTLLLAGKEMSLVYNGDKLRVKLNLTNLAQPAIPGDGRLRVPGADADFYAFQLIIPRGKAVAKINGQVLSGYGSLDQSYTNTGFQKVSRHWTRTTYHDDTVSILFAVNTQKDGTSAGWVSVATNDTNYWNDKPTIALGSSLPDPDKKGYSAWRQLSLSGADGFSLSLPAMQLKSKADMLENLSKIEAFVVRRFSDPMRYAFDGTAHLTLPGQAAPLERPIVVVTKQMNP